MTTLVRASDLGKRPVVTLAGEAVAQVKDTVFEGSAGQVAGFTLSGRGLLSGPLHRALPWSAVHALGPDAVMITGEGVLERRKEVLHRSGTGAGGDVLGARVMTDAGADLGEVVDVVIETGAAARVAGYEVAPGEAGRHDRTAFLPLPETLAVSGGTLVVPALAAEFLAEDLPGFADTMRAYHDRRREEG